MIAEREGFDEDRTLWEQVYELILERIDDGTYLERKALPSIYRLADDIGVSHATVRRVLDLMKQQGVVRAISGKGTYVRPRDEWLID